MAEETKSPYLIPLAIVVAGALVGAGLYFGGRQPVPPVAQVVEPEQPGEQGNEGQVAGEEEVPQYEKTTGDFLILNEEPCQENGKPIVYFFGSSGCSHCQWEYPRLKDIAAKFGDQISFHDNMDDKEGKDGEIIEKYGSEVVEKYRTIDPNANFGVPFIVLGCKYARMGSGERAGEEAEKQALTQLICELTGNQPSGVCP